MSEQSEHAVVDFHELEVERRKVMEGLLVGFGGSTALIGFIWLLHFVFGG